jgi:hypothetical protein
MLATVRQSHIPCLIRCLEAAKVDLSPSHLDHCDEAWGDETCALVTIDVTRQGLVAWEATEVDYQSSPNGCQGLSVSSDSVTGGSSSAMSQMGMNEQPLKYR